MCGKCGGGKKSGSHSHKHHGSHHHGGHHKGTHHAHHHKGATHHKGSHHTKAKHKVKSLGGKALVRDMLSTGGGAITQGDRDMANLVNQVASALLSGGFAAEIISAIETVVGQQVSQGPGRLLAGTISNLAGAIQPAAGGDTNLVMVFLVGSTVAVPVYVPPHLWPDVAPGLEVWVEPANGNQHDLTLYSIRNFTSAPASNGYEASSHASSTYETQTHASSTYETQAHASSTYATLATVAGLLIATGATTVNGTTAGTAKWAMPLQGTGLKVLVIIFNGYENTTATPQNFVLPVDFTSGAAALYMVGAFGGTGVNPKDGGGVAVTYQSATVGSAGNPGSFTGRTGFNAASVGYFAGTIHSIDLPISNTGTGSGAMILVGF